MSLEKLANLHSVLPDKSKQEVLMFACQLCIFSREQSNLGNRCTQGKTVKDYHHHHALRLSEHMTYFPFVMKFLVIDNGGTCLYPQLLLLLFVCRQNIRNLISAARGCC